MAPAPHIFVFRLVLTLLAGATLLSACDSSKSEEEESTITKLANTQLEVSVVSAVSGKTTSLPLSDNFTITFTKAVQSLSMTTSSGGSCSGSVQLSGDNFSNCESAILTANGTRTAYTLTPQVPLKTKTSYKVRVTTSVKDDFEKALSASYTSAAFVTQSLCGNGACSWSVVSASNWNSRSYHGSTSWQSSLWVLGGRDDTHVQASTSGSAWTQKTQGVVSPFKRSGLGVAVFSSKAWVLGGQNASGQLVSDAWSSSNGTTWNSKTMTCTDSASGSTCWAARYRHAVVTFGGKLWIFGGESVASASVSYLNDVWSSSDGTTWTQQSPTCTDCGSNNNCWSGRSGHAVTVFNNALWLTGGTTSSGASREVWTSSNGTTWTCKTLSPAWSARSGHASIEYEGALWVLGGQNGSSINSLETWQSTDGASWTSGVYGRTDGVIVNNASESGLTAETFKCSSSSTNNCIFLLGSKVWRYGP
ncbi:MAG: Ig-like domain-containing protein [SAR324 cluster bacterium]|nr:Ig-like domain-containing protein [SAR324 cluster bacterium]